MLPCSYWDTAFVYVFAELFGAVIAAALVLPLYGFGQFGSLFDARIFKAFGLSIPKHLAQVQNSPDIPSSSRCITRQAGRPGLMIAVTQKSFVFTCMQKSRLFS